MSTSIPSSVRPLTVVATPTTPSRVDVDKDLEKWQNSGFQVVVQLPYVPTPQGYLFMYRIDIQKKDFLSNDPLEVVQEPPIIIPGDYVGESGGDAISVTASQIAETPVINRLAKCHVKARGDAEVRFTLNCNMGTSGYFQVLLVQTNSFSKCQLGKFDTNRGPYPTMFSSENRERPIIPDFDIRDAQHIGYVRLNAANTSAFVVKVPFMNSAEMIDQKVNISCLPNSLSDGVSGSKSFASYDKEQYILLRAATLLDSPTNKPIVVVIEERWENVQMSDYLGPLPKMLHSSYYTAVKWTPDSKAPDIMLDRVTYRPLTPKDFPIFWPTPSSREITLVNGILYVKTGSSRVHWESEFRLMSAGLINFGDQDSVWQENMLKYLSGRARGDRYLVNDLVDTFMNLSTTTSVPIVTSKRRSRYKPNLEVESVPGPSKGDRYQTANKS